MSMNNYPCITKLLADRLTESHDKLRKLYIRGLITFDEMKQSFMEQAESVNAILDLLDS